MPSLSEQSDWRQLASRGELVSIVDSRRRMRYLLSGFVLFAAVVLTRCIQLEVVHGEAYRQQATQVAIHETAIVADRGRILARDGTVLAEQQPTMRLMMAYRVLTPEPNPAWLRRAARRKLSAEQRKDPAILKKQIDAIQEDYERLHRLLAQASGVSPAEWASRQRRIETRVERIADRVNARRLALYEQRQQPTDANSDTNQKYESRFDRYWNQIYTALGSTESLPPKPIRVAEQVASHALAEGLDSSQAEAIQEIMKAAGPEFQSEVELQSGTRRVYGQGSLAAHVLGYVQQDQRNVPGFTDDSPRNLTIDPIPSSDTRESTYSDWVGRNGIERQYDFKLAGTPGALHHLRDREGRTKQTEQVLAPRAGEDLRLTLDITLQQAAESLLDSALARRSSTDEQAPTGGGAIVLLDCHSGELLVAASAPRFDPNIFTLRDTSAIQHALASEDSPLLDRVGRMALPPGSVMKTISAVALLEEGITRPDESFSCQGFLNTPDKQRCYIYSHYGVGHGEITLAGALARSCNVFFFHHGPKLGGRALTVWAERFSLGRATGVDLPGESAGNLPTPESKLDKNGQNWNSADSQAVSIGQGKLTATPLQIARAIGAIANGGDLVTPHVVMRGQRSEVRGRGSVESAESVPIPGLHAETLRVVRRGMRQAVADEEGTAHQSLDMPDLAIAAKTGTAQSGPGRADHAWIAGYLPADSPRYVIVVALEHAGGGSSAAGPVARRLVEQMRSSGYFDSLKSTRR